MLITLMCIFLLGRTIYPPTTTSTKELGDKEVYNGVPLPLYYLKVALQPEAFSCIHDKFCDVVASLVTSLFPISKLA